MLWNCFCPGSIRCCTGTLQVPVQHLTPTMRNHAKSKHPTRLLLHLVSAACCSAFALDLLRPTLTAKLLFMQAPVLQLAPAQRNQPQSKHPMLLLRHLICAAFCSAFTLDILQAISLLICCGCKPLYRTQRSQLLKQPSYFHCTT